MVEIETVIARLDGVTQHGDQTWKARCPAHDDRSPSLKVSIGERGILLRCFAGCAFLDICDALGIKQQELFKDHGMPDENANWKETARYDYRDESGEVLYQVIRQEDMNSPSKSRRKRFRQRHRDEKRGWVWNMDGVRRVLYNLTSVVDPILAEQPILVVEGEKCVDALGGVGFVAVCNVGGAGKWIPEYSEQLSGRRCVVIPDNDNAGKRHALEVCSSLLWDPGMAASVRYVELPVPEKCDVVDYLNGGGTRRSLIELIKSETEFKRE